MSADRITQQGFACGDVDTSHGAGTRIVGRGSGYLAHVDGATLYLGPSLTAARAACDAYARNPLHAALEWCDRKKAEPDGEFWRRLDGSIRKALTMI